MKRKPLYVIVFVVALIAGCSKVEIAGTQESDVETIRMKPAVSTLQPVSRTPFTDELGNGITLTAWVPASSTSGDYTSPYANGTMTFSGVNNPVAYNGDGFTGNGNLPDNAETPLYLRGFYPATGWTKTVNQVTISFAGKEDIMMAAEVSTTKKKVREQNFATLEFEHQLTLLEIAVQTENNKAETKWGKVLGIEVAKTATSQIETSLTVNLSTGAVSFGNPQSTLATFSISVTGGRTIYTDDAYVSTTLVAGEPEFVAYILAPPLLATSSAKEYTFKVKTLKDGAETVSSVDVDLNDVNGNPFTGSTAGYSFVVTFYFLSGEISAVATVKKWQAGGSTIVPIE